MAWVVDTSVFPKHFTTDRHSCRDLNSARWMESASNRDWKAALGASNAH